MTDNQAATAAEKREMDTRETPLRHLSIDRDARIELTIQEIIGKSINIVGLKRSGKTNTGGVIAEEWLNHNLPMTVVDRQNEWWGLAQAYPFIIAGRGRRATIPLDIAHAADLAEFSFRRKTSVILSLLKYEEEEQWAILQAYFERLLELAEEAFDEERPEPYAIILEEARTYLPLAEKTPVKSVLKEIVLGGGKLGLTTLLLNQRLAGTDTDCASQADLYFLHRVAHPRDRMIYKEIIPYPSREVDRMINDLATGEAIVVNGGQAVIARIREQATYHAGATPRFKATEQARRGSLDHDVLAQAQAIMTRESQGSQSHSPEHLTACACAPCRASAKPLYAELSLLSSQASPAKLSQPADRACPCGENGRAAALLYFSQTVPILSRRKALSMTSLTPTPDIKRTGNMLIDQEAQSHTIACSDQHFQVDGEEASIIAIDQQHVTIVCAGGTIVVTTADFWSATIGDEDPTREDGGMLLAQNIARWAAGREQKALIQHWLEQGQGLETLCLPPPHLDPVTRALLEAAASDDSEEGQRAIVYMLQKRHPDNRVAELFQQVGLQMADLRAGAEERGHNSGKGAARGAHPRKQDEPGAGASSPRRQPARRKSSGQFQWTPEMAADLEREFMESQAESISEAAREIGERHGWPKERVSYKIWYMKLPKRKQPAATITEEGSAADREETSTEGDVPDQANSF